MAKARSFPRRYRSDDQWSSLLWLDPKDVISLLKFDQELSEGLSQVKWWFMKRMLENGYSSGLPGIWSDEGRMIARNELLQMTPPPELESESSEELIFGKKYII